MSKTNRQFLFMSVFLGFFFNCAGASLKPWIADLLKPPEMVAIFSADASDTEDEKSHGLPPVDALLAAFTLAVILFANTLQHRETAFSAQQASYTTFLPRSPPSFY